jgi:proteasome beta subunit
MHGSNRQYGGIGGPTDGRSGGGRSGWPPADAPDLASALDAPTQETGTTVVGVRAPEAVVLAADRRASLGGRFVSNKDTEKIERVHPRAAVGLSGSVGGVQALARRVRAEVDLYDARRGEPPTIAALATLTGDLIRGVPAQVLLGGVDGEGSDGAPEEPASGAGGSAHLFELDGGGAVSPTEYAAAGSGLQVAYGTLEGRAGEVETAEAAREVAADAVAAASERDTASGDGLTLATVTDGGVETEVRGGEA